MKSRNMIIGLAVLVLAGVFALLYGSPAQAKQAAQTTKLQDSPYFAGTGITYQHGGGYLFCRDKKIMNWLFSKEKGKK